MYYDFDSTSGVSTWQVLRIVIAVVAFAIGIMRSHYYSQRHKERVAQELAARDEANRTAFAEIVASPSKPFSAEPAGRHN